MSDEVVMPLSVYVTFWRRMLCAIENKGGLEILPADLRSEMRQSLRRLAAEEDLAQLWSVDLARRARRLLGRAYRPSLN